MGGREKEREKEKERGREPESDLLSPETPERRWEAQGVIGGTPAQQMQPRRRGELRLHCSGGGVSPRTWKLWRGVARRGAGGGGRGGGTGGGGGEKRRRGTAAREAEAAYQAVSCGDKQSPEVIGVHAACLLLLEDAGTAEKARPRVDKRGRPMCTAGKQDSGRSGGDRGGPERPGKGEGVQIDTGREKARAPVRWNTQRKRWKW